MIKTEKFQGCEEDHHEYHKAVKAYLEKDSRKLKRLLKSPQLSQVHKKLLEVRVAFRSNDWNRAYDILHSISLQKDSLLEGDRLLLWGNYYCYRSEWKMALLMNSQAAKTFTKEHADRLFKAHYNLSVDYQRLGNHQLSEYHLKTAKKWTQTQPQQALILRALIAHYHNQKKYEETQKYIEDIPSLLVHLSEVDFIPLQLLICDVYATKHNWSQCLPILKKLRESKVSREKARILLYDHLAQRAASKNLLKPLPNPSKQVKENEEYYSLWMVIRSLQIGDREEAQKNWLNLCTLAPQRYSSTFFLEESTESIRGENLISAFLNLMSQPKVIRGSNPYSSKTLPGQLIEILSQSTMPLRKEEIIERLWKCNYDPHLDSRFYKLIERTKSSQCLIENVNQAYRIKIS